MIEMETETALLWGFFVLLLVVIATLIGLLLHSGLLSEVVVKTCKPAVGEIQIAYKFARGPYKESGFLYTEVHTLLPEYRTLGVYYDDPKTNQAHKLRYIVGIILSENGSEVNPNHIKTLEQNGYHFATFPSIDHAVQTKFPFNSTISIIVAIMKVYPAIREYIENRSLCARPFLEVYDSEKKEIVFIGPLARQDDFYVPEVLQEEEEDHKDDEFDDDRTENSSRSWDESASIIRGHEINDSECSESVGDDSSSFAKPSMPPPPPVIGTSSDQPLLPTSSDNVCESVVPSASANDHPSSDIGENIESASVGDAESDANTASSFEEIDEKEAASIPHIEMEFPSPLQADKDKSPGHDDEESVTTPKAETEVTPNIEDKSASISDIQTEQAPVNVQMIPPHSNVETVPSSIVEAVPSSSIVDQDSSVNSSTETASAASQPVMSTTTNSPSSSEIFTTAAVRESSIDEVER